jgi:hypothetical protein
MLLEQVESLHAKLRERPQRAGLARCRRTAQQSERRRMSDRLTDGWIQLIATNARQVGAAAESGDDFRAGSDADPLDPALGGCVVAPLLAPPAVLAGGGAAPRAIKPPSRLTAAFSVPKGTLAACSSGSRPSGRLDLNQRPPAPKMHSVLCGASPLAAIRLRFAGFGGSPERHFVGVRHRLFPQRFHPGPLLPNTGSAEVSRERVQPTKAPGEGCW